VEAFLEKVISEIIAKDVKHLEVCCFVVPNRRTGLYLKKYLSEKIKKTIFSPQFLTIDEFASKVSGLETSDNLTLLSLLYQSYKETLSDEKTTSHPFDEFVTWGNILLADFNDIDSQLADAEKVFSYLSEAKAIAQWNPDNPILTPFQKNYLTFYNSLSGIYSVFLKKLLENKIAYQGLMYKHIVENNLCTAFSVTWEMIYFVGFNALTLAEENIVDFYIKNNKGQLFFDYDHYYLDNKITEAGNHIRKSISKWGKSPFHDDLNSFKIVSKKISVIGIPQNIGQAKVCGLLLSKFKTTDKPNDTALVLPKEDLLFPVLNSLPENIEYTNVTMGYPLDKTLIYDLFESFITLYENAFRIQKLKADSKLKFNVKDLLKITENPFLNQINSFEISYNQEATYSFNKRLVKDNKLFYTSDQLATLIQEIFIDESLYTDIIKLIFSVDEQDSLKMVHLLTNVLNIIKNANVFQQKQAVDLSVEIEFLYYYSKLLKKLEVFFETVDNIEVNSFRVLHRLLAKSLSVPFTGEPLSGLQIMGLLESRNLDFKNVIMLSVNEGVLPLSKANNSFIPIDIRRHFKLPVYFENESIYAYHFYRLLQRAENIYLIYNTEHDILGSGERSRFISQLLYELPKYNNAINITESIITAPLISDKNDYSIYIEKTEDVLKLINEKTVKGISPSSLSVYLQCNLRFYFQYILRIEATEEPDETIDAAQLGSAIHFALEEIYKPFAGKSLYKKDITLSVNDIEDLLIRAFKEDIQHIDVNFGKNHLLFKIAFKYLNNFLNEEKKLLDSLSENGQKLIIESTEKQFDTQLNICSNGKNIPIKLIGKVDRIDRTGNLTRIIDYKSGTIDSKDLNLKDWEMLADDTISGKIIQLLMYSYLYASNFKQINFVSGFTSMKKPDEGLLILKFPGGDESYNNDIHAQFENFLVSVFEKLYDKTIPITQTKNEKNCKFCDFKKICNRL